MDNNSTVQDLAQELYSYLARRFPVCCWSDEFVFFPQALEENTDYSVWDDLSPDSVKDAVDHLRRFRGRLGESVCSGGVDADGEQSLSGLLNWVTRNLEEQFTHVRTHATQPTFALTAATMGLIQALQSGKGEAFSQRLRTLPWFLKRAFESLASVPELYRDLGVKMAGDVTRWIGSFDSGSQAGPALESVREYGEKLSRLPVKKDFYLDPDILERAVRYHTGSMLSLAEAIGELEDEAAVTIHLLKEEARKLGHGSDWEKGYSAIGGDPVPDGGTKELLRFEIERLRDHCMQFGLRGPNRPERSRLSIEFLPPSLSSIRAADSYNAIPGYPFQGGVLYIFGGGSLGNSSGKIHPVYRMTAAHEVYPGHHLLDLCRWTHPEPVLRPVEYPLFYEGWACFGEDLMLDTGAFDRSYDRLILLRRRFRHAIRGMVDLKFHSGKTDLSEAARNLMSAGFSGKRAVDTVRKYALRPAYQMCYTIGRRRFGRLFESCGQGDVSGFVNKVLSSGELLFEDLEKVIKEGTGRETKGGDEN